MIAHVKANLASYKAPKRVMFVVVARAQPAGKLDYVGLLARRRWPRSAPARGGRPGTAAGIEGDAGRGRRRRTSCTTRPAGTSGARSTIAARVRLRSRGRGAGAGVAAWRCPTGRTGRPQGRSRGRPSIATSRSMTPEMRPSSARMLAKVKSKWTRSPVLVDAVHVVARGSSCSSFRKAVGFGRVRAHRLDHTEALGGLEDQTRRRERPRVPGQRDSDGGIHLVQTEDFVQLLVRDRSDGFAWEPFLDQVRAASMVPKWNRLGPGSRVRARHRSRWSGARDRRLHRGPGGT